MSDVLSPALSGVCLALSILGIVVYSLLLSRTARRTDLPQRGLLLLGDLVSIGYFFVWSLLLALAAASLMFDPVTNLVMRWITVAAVFSGMLLAFSIHDWMMLIPALSALLSLPFFETSFGSTFPYVYFAMLLLYLGYGVFRLARDVETRPLSVRAIPEALDVQEEGLLFCEADGTLLLCNRKMRSLAAQIFGAEPENGLEFWDALQAAPESERYVRHATAEGCVFRITGGDTWTFHRQENSGGWQLTALNVTASDGIQREIAVKKAELDRTAAQLQQVEETIRQLREEQARLARGRKGFEIITEKMTALSRFFAEHYALPAETFDYKKLAELTAGLLQELEHTPVLTPAQSMNFTAEALRLLNVTVTLPAAMPGEEAADAAVAAILREAAVNAVLHGGAKHVTAAAAQTPEGWSCTIQNDGAPLSGTLTPGGGITAMRRSLFPLGGTLEIDREPVFTLTVRIPKKK